MSDVELSATHRKAIEEVSRWEEEALVELGRAQIQYKDLMRQIEIARVSLETREIAARQAHTQTQMVLNALSAELQLPPGYWTYDAVAGKLVRKDDHA